MVTRFGFADPPEPPEARFEVIDGTVHCISQAAAERLVELREHFDLVWASGWEARARQLLGPLGLPDVPYLRFGGAAKFGSADWKLGPLGDYAAGRALAWIDDSFDERCYAWARGRPEQTLLIGVESDSGLLDVHVEALIGWACGLRREREEMAR